MKANRNHSEVELSNAVGRGVGAKGMWDAMARLAMGWPAYVEEILSMDALVNAGIEVAKQVGPPATVEPSPSASRALAPMWKRLCELVTAGSKSRAASSLGELRGPALAEDLVAIEQRWKLQLPEDFVAWLALHDGGHGRDGGGPFPWGVMSLARSARWKEDMESMAERMRGYNVEEDDEAVRAVYWHDGWWPFSTSGGGDLKCLDLAPTKQGKRGQVIDWPHDYNTRSVETPSFMAYLERLMANIERGEYVVENGAIMHSRLAKNTKAPKKTLAKKPATRTTTAKKLRR